MGEFSVALAAASKGKRCVQGVKICGFARVVNRARTPLRAPMGFELFISFLQYFEFHCQLTAVALTLPFCLLLKVPY